MAINLNLKSTPSAIESVLGNWHRTSMTHFSGSDLEGMGLKGFEHELRRVFAEAERGVVG